MTDSVLLKRYKVISVWDPDPDKIMARYESGQTSMSLNSILGYFDFPFINKSQDDITTIVDKNPSYSFHIDILNRLYPDAKFIVLVRDYRDNITSRKKSDTSSLLKSPAIYAAAWSYYYEYIEKLASKYPEKILYVKYEDLVLNTNESVRKICQFIQVPYRDEMLQPSQFINFDYEKFKEKINKEEFLKISEMHKNLKLDINPRSIGAGTKQLSKWELMVAQTICDNIGNRFGYQPTIEISVISKVLIWIWYSPLIIYTRVYTFIFTRAFYLLPIRIKLFLCKFGIYPS